MANITVSVTDANNITVQLTPVASQTITIDRGVAGNGISSIVPVTISTLQYLRIYYTNGTQADVGPLTSTAYFGETPISIVGNTITLTTVPITKGGTGAITAAAAIQNLLPSYTGNASKRLGLNSGATALEWVADGGGTVTSVAVDGGTTGLTTSGGPITGSGTITLAGTLAVLNGGTGVTTSTGTGSVVLSTSPSLVTPVLGTPTSGNFSTGTFTWPTFNQNTSGTAAGLSATLVIASGGTNGTATPTAGAVPYGTGTAYAFTAAGTAGQILQSNGASAPTWSNLSSLGVSSFSAGTTGFTPSTATSGAVTLAGTLATTNGGTGLTSFTNGGIVYASSTSALSTGSVLVFDGTNLGVGVTPSAWNLVTGFQVGRASLYGYAANEAGFQNNAFYSTVAPSGWKYIANGFASQIQLDSSGSLAFKTAPSGTANAGVTFTQAMTLDASGRLLVGDTTAPSGGLPNILSANSAGGGIQFYHKSSTGGGLIGGIGGGGLLFYTYTGAIGSETYTERMRLDASGNLSIKPTNDGGLGLDIYRGNSGGYLNSWARITDASGVMSFQQIDTSSSAGFNWKLSSNSGSSFTTPMTLDASGRLLLNTTSTIASAGRLQVVSGSGQDPLYIQSTAIDGYSGINFYNNSSANVFSVGYANASAGVAASTGYIYTGGATPITFWTNATERARIDSSGNLGLGVAPEVWLSSFRSLDIGSTASFAYFSDGLYLYNNTYYTTGSSQVYKQNGYAQSYIQTGTGQHIWQIAPNNTSGADAALIFTQAMTLDASGNLMVGTTTIGSGNRMNVVGNNVVFSPNTAGKDTHTFSTGAADVGTYVIKNDTTTKVFLNAGGDSYFTGGNLLVGTTSDLGARFNVSTGTRAWAGWFQQVNNAGNSVVMTEYSTGAPNNSTDYFGLFRDTGGQRIQLRSNGGIGNYQGNDANLSDRREKTNFAPAKSYLDVICAIPVQTFNYIDQNMEDDGGLTLGVVAQDVQVVAPELVTETNWANKDDEPKMRLSIYQTDMQYALMKALQELKAEFDAYKASHP